MEGLKNLLAELGLSPAATAATILVVAILVFFAKRALDERQKRKSTKRSTLEKYLLDQEQALLKAYRLLYEERDLNTLSPNEFVEIVSQADDIIMEPFTRCRGVLPPDVQAKIYDDIHDVLAQFKPDPTSRHEAKPEAIRKLSQYGESFLQQIESAKIVISRHL